MCVKKHLVNDNFQSDENVICDVIETFPVVIESVVHSNIFKRHWTIFNVVLTLLNVVETIFNVI